MPSRRQLRVAEIMRHHLAAHLAMLPLQLKKRQVEVVITVTAVSMSPDLKHAKIFVRCMKTKTTPSNWLDQLGLLRKSIRSSLQLDLKFTPDIHFEEDESFSYADRIEAIIAKDRHLVVDNSAIDK